MFNKVLEKISLSNLFQTKLITSKIKRLAKASLLVVSGIAILLPVICSLPCSTPHFPKIIGGNAHSSSILQIALHNNNDDLAFAGHTLDD